MATLAAPLARLADLLDPNVVKVVADAQGRALYFSRAPIPWNRDAAPAGLTSQTNAGARRHVGIYAYRVAALQRLAALATGASSRSKSSSSCARSPMASRFGWLRRVSCLGPM